MVGVFVATQEEWMFEPHNWFSNPPLKMSTLVKHYYCAEFGNYVYAIISMLFLEPRQKDFVQMLSHHFVTMGLIWMSYLWGYHRWVESKFYIWGLRKVHCKELTYYY